MGKSARILGIEFGLNAQEMNRALKKHGFLEGDPGAYKVTEKGSNFVASETDHKRGTGGYAHFNASWEQRTWKQETADALRAEGVDPMAIRADKPQRTVSHSSLDDENHFDTSPEPSSGDQASNESSPGMAIIGGALVIAGITSEIVIPWWRNSGRNMARSFRSKLSRNRSSS